MPNGRGQTCHRRCLASPPERLEAGKETAALTHRLGRAEDAMDGLENTLQRLTSEFESVVSMTMAQQLTMEALVARLR